MEFEVPMHPKWGEIIEHVSPINGAVRAGVHRLVGGYLDLQDAEDASYWCAVLCLYCTVLYMYCTVLHCMLTCKTPRAPPTGALYK
eukprot:1189442-Prorocentrum_minimum.AAC.1